MPSATPRLACCGRSGKCGGRSMGRRASAAEVGRRWTGDHGRQRHENGTPAVLRGRRGRSTAYRKRGIYRAQTPWTRWAVGGVEYLLLAVIGSPSCPTGKLTARTGWALRACPATRRPSSHPPHSQGHIPRHQPNGPAPAGAPTTWCSARPQHDPRRRSLVPRVPHQPPIDAEDLTPS